MAESSAGAPLLRKGEARVGIVDGANLLADAARVSLGARPGRLAARSHTSVDARS
jgi:hypothetical protein